MIVSATNIFSYSSSPSPCTSRTSRAAARPCRAGPGRWARVSARDPVVSPVHTSPLLTAATRQAIPSNTRIMSRASRSITGLMSSTTSGTSLQNSSAQLTRFRRAPRTRLMPSGSGAAYVSPRLKTAISWPSSTSRPTTYRPTKRSRRSPVRALYLLLSRQDSHFAGAEWLAVWGS